MSAPVRVLTVFQPWASLIIVGAKPYEFRSKRPPRTILNQRIVIHAAARKIVPSEVHALIRAIENRPANPQDCAQTCLHQAAALPVLWQAVLPAGAVGSLPIGCGLGTAICGEGRNGYDIAEEFGAEHVNDSDRDDHANYGWPMSDIEVWPEPIPARGSQGIWFWPTPTGLGL